MALTISIFLIILAVAFWSLGDFFIQRTTRSVGDWQSLFYIGLCGLIILTPFVYKDLHLLTNIYNFSFLFFMSVITLISALFLFEGLKIGKLAVIEPVFGSEMLFTVGFSYLFGGERLSPLTYFLIAIVFVGLMLVVTRRLAHLKIGLGSLEKGVVYAAVGSMGMGMMNFLVGYGSQKISPLLTIWYSHVFLFVVCGLKFVITGEINNMYRQFKTYPGVIAAQSFFDNLAWVFYAMAMTRMPISVATALTESYIIFSVLLGVKINKEKLKHHQKIGVVVAVGGAIILAFYAT